MMHGAWGAWPWLAARLNACNLAAACMGFGKATWKTIPHKSMLAYILSFYVLLLMHKAYGKADG